MKAFLNRLLGMAGIAATTANSNENAGAQTLQVQILGLGGPAELRDPLPSTQLYGFASAPVPGAHHVVIFLGGDRTKGVAIASNDPRYRPQGLKPGEAMVHNNTGVQLYLSEAGLVINSGGLPIIINGNILLNGKLTATGDVVGNGISLDNHTHSDPQGGTVGAPQG